MEAAWRRWLQALSVLQFMATFLFLGPGALLLLLALLRSRLWLLPALYGAWWLRDCRGRHRGPRHSAWVRGWKVWGHFCDYFPIKVVRTAPLPPGRSYLLPTHPHGVACLGAFGAFISGGRGAAGGARPGEGARGEGEGPGPFPGLRFSLAALAGLFLLPLYREYAMAAGLCPVSRRCLERLLAAPGQAVLLMVGGAAEALEPSRGRHRVTLRDRKGFVRLALRLGTPLVPVYVFGEEETFYQPPLAEGSWARGLQLGVKKLLGFSPCLFWGRGGLPLLPYSVPLTVVVGAPLEVPRRPQPTPQEVAEYHQRYLQSLQQLFEGHKAACGVPPDVHLTIV